MQVAYAIGMAQPLSILVETFGTNAVSNETIEQGGARGVRPAPRRDHPRPRPQEAGLQETAAYGHFGRPGFTWEDTNRLDDFKAAVGL